jgi:hypothetical protein
VPGVLSIHDMHVWQLSDSYAVVSETDTILTLSTFRITLATFHVRVLNTTDLAAWENIETILHQCCAGYGIAHVTAAPEIEHQPLNLESRIEAARVRAVCDGGSTCATDDARIRKRIPKTEPV